MALLLLVAGIAGLRCSLEMEMGEDEGDVVHSIVEMHAPDTSPPAPQRLSHPWNTISTSFFFSFFFFRRKAAPSMMTGLRFNSRCDENGEERTAVKRFY